MLENFNGKLKVVSLEDHKTEKKRRQVLEMYKQSLESMDNQSTSQITADVLRFVWPYIQNLDFEGRVAFFQEAKLAAKNAQREVEYDIPILKERRCISEEECERILEAIK